MKRIIDLATEEDFKLFEEVLNKVNDGGNIVATLKQVTQGADGKYVYTDVRQVVAEMRPLIRLNDTFFYMTVRDIRQVEARRLIGMWDLFLQRGTQRFAKGESNDYLLTIDLAKNELSQGFIYCFTAVAPIFASADGNNNYTFVFATQDVRITKDEVTFYDVDYEASLRESSGDDVHKFEDYSDENFDVPNDGEYDETDDFVNVSNFTDTQ